MCCVWVRVRALAGHTASRRGSSVGRLWRAVPNETQTGSSALSPPLAGWAGPSAQAQPKLSSASVPQAQAQLIYPSAVQSNLNKHISPAPHLEALSRRGPVQRASPLRCQGLRGDICARTSAVRSTRWALVSYSGQKGRALLTATQLQTASKSEQAMLRSVRKCLIVMIWMSFGIVMSGLERKQKNELLNYKRLRICFGVWRVDIK